MNVPTLGYLRHDRNVIEYLLTSSEALESLTPANFDIFYSTQLVEKAFKIKGRSIFENRLIDLMISLRV